MTSTGSLTPAKLFDLTGEHLLQIFSHLYLLHFVRSPFLLFPLSHQQVEWLLSLAVELESVSCKLKA